MSQILILSRSQDRAFCLTDWSCIHPVYTGWGQRSGHPYSGWLYTLIMWAHNLSLNSNIAGHILFCPSYVIKKQLSINIIMKIIMPLTIIYMIPSNAYTHDKFVSCTPVITGSFHTTLFSSTCLSTYPSINIILFYFYMCPLILQSPPSWTLSWSGFIFVTKC